MRQVDESALVLEQGLAGRDAGFGGGGSLEVCQALPPEFGDAVVLFRAAASCSECGVDGIAERMCLRIA